MKLCMEDLAYETAAAIVHVIERARDNWISILIVVILFAMLMAT